MSQRGGLLEPRAKTVRTVSAEPREELAARVRDAIKRHQLIRRGERVLVGVSGGADSIALLHLLTQLRPAGGWNLYAVHVDHGLRETSPDDAAFVRAFGEALGIPVIVESREVAARCREAGWSLEDGARRIRYACFLDAARRYSAGVLALAHTADDQAETVLMRLIRGAGATGLGAIPLTRPMDGVRVVRPLLRVWRRDILEYLRAAGLCHREDASNADVRFLRNRIRHELLPLLERAYNPNIRSALTQLAEQSRCDAAFLQDTGERQWRRVARSIRSGRVSVDLKGFGRQPLALQRQLVRQAIRQVRGDLSRFEFRHWLELEPLFHSRPLGTVVELPGGVRAVRERDHVRFEAETNDPATAMLD